MQSVGTRGAARLESLTSATGFGRNGESCRASGHRLSGAEACVYLKHQEIDLLPLFPHLRELEGHLRGHLLRGNIVLLLVQEVLDALLVDLDFHLHRYVCRALHVAGHRRPQHAISTSQVSRLEVSGNRSTTNFTPVLYGVKM